MALREIIFRGKRLDNGEWVEGWYEMYPFGRWPVKSSIIPSEEAKNGRYEHVQVDISTVGQYTGLRDKNGECIFEGDVLTVDGEDGFFVLEFQEDTARFVMIGDIIQVDFDNFYSIEVEVVGNIHDNPELLEVSEND